MKEKCPNCGSKKQEARSVRNYKNHENVFCKCEKCKEYYFCRYEKVLKKINLISFDKE